MPQLQHINAKSVEAAYPKLFLDIVPMPASFPDGKSKNIPKLAAASELSVNESICLASLSVACLAIIANAFCSDGKPLVASLAFSGLAFSISFSMIRWLGPTFVQAGLKGKDMSKLHPKELPETMGAICAVVYLLVVIVFIPLPFYKDIVAATSGGGNRDIVIELELESVHTGRLLHKFPHSKLASYLSAILSLQSVSILGFCDDLFNIRWRHKFFIPGIASIPILIVYFVDFGVTQIVVPIPFRPYLGGLYDLGVFYYIYMFAVAIFCPNSINILAGINGIEVSQSLVIALLLVLNDCLYLPVPYQHPATDSHLFSLYIILPFVGVSLALWWHNRYPSRVFVGDTYCYFAGMVFVVVGVLGHFSKTLLLLFIPQIFNFIYSVPQLFHIVPCPRHRLPHFNARSGLMEFSVVKWERPCPTPITILVKLLHHFHLVHITTNVNGVITESSNFTLLNLWLFWFGPKREDKLTREIILLQGLIGLMGLFVRHNCALLIFESDNLGV